MKAGQTEAPSVVSASLSSVTQLLLSVLGNSCFCCRLIAEESRMSRSSRHKPAEGVIVLSERRTQRRLKGLTTEERIEFQTLDALSPIDENGQIAWTFEGGPTNERERRWLELYTKITSGD